MYRGFNLTIDQIEFTEFINEGRKIHETQLNETNILMDNFILTDNILDGTAIRNFWFPEIKADIFLSHSRADFDQVMALAGWLNEKFDLTVFIDSSVWLHGKMLKKKLADTYCRINDGLYGYDSFSHAASHVDIMLSSALSMMIDKCECLFFLNTPNAIKAYGNNAHLTESVWIYNEIGISKIIEKKKPKRWVTESVEMTETFSKGLSGFKIAHEVDLEHLIPIGKIDLESWLKKKNKEEFPLDTLYRLVNGNQIQHLN